MQERVYQVPIRDTHELRQRLLKSALNFSRGWWTMRLISGGQFEHLLWRCLPDIQVATQHNRLFSQPPVPRNTTRLFRAMETIYLPWDEWVLHFTR